MNVQRYILRELFFRALSTLAVLVLVALPVLALAQVSTSSAVEVSPEAIGAAIEAGQWPLAIGLLFTFLVGLARKTGLLGFLPIEAQPWVAIGLSVLTVVGSGLVASDSPIAIVITGIVAAATGVAGYFAGKKTGEKLSPNA